MTDGDRCEQPTPSGSCDGLVVNGRCAICYVIHDHDLYNAQPDEDDNRNWPFFNESATCPKCAGTEISANWRPAGSYAKGLSVFDRDRGDWIQRHCERCHHEWPEEPLDRT